MAWEEMTKEKSEITKYNPDTDPIAKKLNYKEYGHNTPILPNK